MPKEGSIVMRWYICLRAALQIAALLVSYLFNVCEAA
jgi:hypothetical protein